MRKFVIASAVLSLSILSACSSSSSSKAPAGPVQTPPQQPGSGEEVVSGPAWTLKLSSACHSNAGGGQCVAQHGFTVDADGKYQVGPAANGQVIKGQLTDTELASLIAKAEATTTVAVLESTAAEQTEEGFVNESNDTLTLVRAGKEKVLAHNTDGTLSFATASSKEALELHSEIRKLATNYYRLPFGTECSVAVSEAEALYAPLQKCEVDLDCAYVRNDLNYTAIEPNLDTVIYTDECVAIKPMLVGNRTAMQDGAAAVLKKYLEVEAKCNATGEFYPALLGSAKNECEVATMSTAVAPKCVQNRCVASQ